MLHIEPIETAPALDLTPGALDTLLEELRGSHAIYRPLFQRREQREWSEKYLPGLLLERPRTSIAPMVLALEGPSQKAVRAMPQLLTAGAWDDEALLTRHGQEVEPALGEEEGVRTLEGSDLPTPGPHSVGVKRPYGGARGKRATCQAGVFWGAASPQGDTVLDRRWSLPQAWLTDEA